MALCGAWHCVPRALAKQLLLRDSPSVSRTLPPVGTQSCVPQRGQATTVWVWLKTVVLQRGRVGGRVGRGLA